MCARFVLVVAVVLLMMMMMLFVVLLLLFSCCCSLLLAVLRSELCQGRLHGLSCKTKQFEREICEFPAQTSGLQGKLHERPSLHGSPLLTSGKEKKQNG